MKAIRYLLPSLLFFALGASSGLQAVNQTATFTPVTIWDKAYKLTLKEYAFGDTELPTLQSFAWALQDGQWLLVAGRTNGLHGFGSTGIENFPPAHQNTDVWLIDPVTQSAWHRSLEDPSAGLSHAEVTSLSATNTEFFQLGETLYIAGGYVYDRVADNFTTYNTLSALHVPDWVAWVKGERETLPGNALLQVEGRTSTDGSYEGGFFQVTGGRLLHMGDAFYLIFGQNFEGPYTPGSNGTYTSQVRTFSVAYDREAGTLDYRVIRISPAPGDPEMFRRRDLNVVPMLTTHEGTTAPEPYAVSLAGVFYQGEGVWTVPVDIGQDGVPVMADPEAPATFKQAMNHYESAKIALYSPTEDHMTQILFGGISANTLNLDIGALIYDGLFGFTSQISAIFRDASGNYHEQYAGRMPTVRDKDGNALLFGANANFFPAAGIDTLSDYIIDIDGLTGPTVLGYVYGGIAAQQPNFGATTASSVVFEVTYEPVGPNANFILDDVRTEADAEYWYRSVLGPLNTRSSPWLFSPSYGFVYSNAGNTVDGAWLYFPAWAFDCWVYLDATLATYGGFWAYAEGGAQVSGWFYMNNAINASNPGNYTLYNIGTGQYEVYPSPAL